MAKRKKKFEDTYPKEEKPVYSVWVGYEDIHISGGEADEPGEQWTSHSTEYKDFRVNEVSLKSGPGWNNRQVITDSELRAGDEVFVIVVRYSTGDTFSHSTGNGTIVAVHPDKSGAQKEVDLIHSEKHPSHYTWGGYFETLEEIEVHKKVVQGEDSEIQGATLFS